MMFISRRYTKVILARPDLEYFYENLKLLNSAYENNKFKEIMHSSIIKKSEKYKFILSFIKGKNQYFENFIKLLLKNNRLDFIARIFAELQRAKNKNENIYIGEVFSKDPPTPSELKQLEKELSHKFKTNIHLELKNSDFDGLRICLFELGYELTFSMDRLQEKINDYVLQAI